MQSNDTAPRRKYAPRMPSVSMACPVCGTDFTLTAARAREYATHCCSEACRDIYAGQRRRVDAEVRFWKRVVQDAPSAPVHHQFGQCWPRLGANRKGYSLFNDGVKKSVIATHFAWTLATGSPLDPGTVIGHVCDNPPCVRNDTTGVYEVGGVTYERHGHLWLAGDHLANARDRTAKNRSPRIGSPLFRLRGEDNIQAKLTTDDVRAIRRLHADGARQVDIAARFGIGQTSVSRIVLRRGWDHVE